MNVLDGRDEGVYGWATVNYLLDTLYPGQGEASGVIDLGGGSVQIVFPIERQRVAPLGYQTQLNFDGRDFNLYVKSHLGYGLDAARDTVYDRLIEADAISTQAPEQVRYRVANGPGTMRVRLTASTRVCSRAKQCLLPVDDDTLMHHTDTSDENHTPFQLILRRPRSMREPERVPDTPPCSRYFLTRLL